MKSEKYVRSFRDNIRKLRSKSKKCTCESCMGREVILATIESHLSWVLDEDAAGIEDTLEELAMEVSRE